jgi:tetratricopeptide (TPR) repeat protein
VRRLLATVTALLLLGSVVSWAAVDMTRDEVLRNGNRSNPAYSLSLVQRASDAASKEDRLALLSRAIQISPDLPSLYFTYAWEKMPDILGGLGAVMDGLKAYAKNFWWSLSLGGLIYISLMVSFLLAAAIIAFMRLAIDLPLLTHDINERKYKLFLPLIPLSASAAGPLGFVATALFISGLYMKKNQKFLVYMVLVFIALSPVALDVADMFYSASAPRSRALVDVNQWRGNDFALDVLKDAKDPKERFTYGLALKRSGAAREAIMVFNELAQSGFDFRAYVNLGNAYVAAGRHDYAKQSYEAALEKEPQDTITLYNLSQVYRDELNYQVGDTYYDQAMKADRDLIATFIPLQGKHYNRLVVDETLTTWDLLVYIWKHSIQIFQLSPWPRWTVSAMAVGMLFLFMLFDRAMRYRAYRCKQCGKIACARCAGEARRVKLCHECHESSRREEESPRARVARMLRANEAKNKLMDRIRLLSFAPPGMAQTYSRRPLTGFFYLWLFCFAVILLILNPFFKAGLAGSSHWWLWVPAIVLVIVLYVMTITSIGRRLSRGWL